MSRVKVLNSDGGKTAEGFAYETNDCTVRALANATGLSYKNAHKYCALAGRKQGQGMDQTQIRRVMELIRQDGVYEIKELLVPQPSFIPGMSIVNSFTRRRRNIRRAKRVGGITVNEFLWRLPKQGQFYLCCTSHAFAVADGVLRDPRQMSRAKMMCAFEIKTIDQRVPAPALAPKVVPPQTPERLAEMEEMKKKIARLEEMAAMKKRIAELEKQLGTPKTMSAAAGQ
jgi:hypothetical protein